MPPLLAVRLDLLRLWDLLVFRHAEPVPGTAAR
jgi:hypothetical protein